MPAGSRTGLVLLVVLAPGMLAGVAGAGTGVAAAETEVAAAGTGPDPGWSDDLLAEMRGGLGEYNERIVEADPKFPGHRMLRDARVNLYVRGPDGARAAYSFRTDGEMRIRGIEEGERDDATVRVLASKEAVERIAESRDPVAAIVREIRSREVRIKRVFGLPFGVTVAVGLAEAALGSGALLVTAAAAKVGAGTIASKLSAFVAELLAAIGWVVGAVVAAAQFVWGNLGRIATALTVFDYLGVLDPIREHARHLWRRLTSSVALAWNRLRRIRPTGGDEEDQ